MMTPQYLSYFLNTDTPAYGGEEGAVQLERIRAIDRGDTSNNMKFAFPAHICTHIDFPYHFDNNGKRAQDYPASFWLFNRVGFLECDIEKVPSAIKELPADIEILILKTGFAAKRGQQEYWASQPVIPASFADLFHEHFPQLRVFGFDMISLTSKLDRAEGKQAHLRFLSDYGILILEDMNLASLYETPGKIVISPLLINDADGAPCTVIAY